NSIFKNSKKELFIFKNFEEYFNSTDIFEASKISIPAKYKQKDIFNIQGCDVFYSERIIESFKNENLTGYDVVTGYFKIDIDFY
ncbi:MAG: hypothetical protein Q4G63_00005, partial [Bacteroidia bacterium]|nr:hypothetical protein [Bacteroidia bacterium]